MANGKTEEFNRMGFWALIGMQFQGAFNDNCYRLLIVLFLPLALVSDDFPSTEVAFALFNGAYLIFPGLMGALSDRYSKQTIAIITKYFELVIMIMALVGFWLQSAWLLLFVLLLMGLQSAFFSPSKYGMGGIHFAQVPPTGCGCRQQSGATR